MATVTEMPPAEVVEMVNSPAETPAKAPNQTPTPPPAKNKGGRPKKGEELEFEVRTKEFFEKVAAVPKADWGTRACMYVYIDEPIVDEKMWGKIKYAKKLLQPIFDLEKIKEWYGSCKGWISLNRRKPDDEETQKPLPQIATHVFEIFDIHCPSKIPIDCWTDDDANRKWSALFPKTPPPPPASAGGPTFLQGFEAYKAVRDDVKSELQVDQPPKSPMGGITEVLTAATQILNVQNGQSNPMVSMFRDEMKAMREELAAERAENRKLAEEIRKGSQPFAAPKGMFESLIEFGGEAMKTRITETIFGKPPGAEAAPVVRAGRTGWMDVVNENLPKFFDTVAPLAQAAALKWTNGAPPVPVAPGAQVATADPFQRFINEIVNPKMRMYFDTSAHPNGPSAHDAGENFADWIYCGFPEFFERLQNFKHPQMPGLVGAQAIITGYRHTPVIWQHLSARENDFIVFVNAFCKWKPPSDEERIPEAEFTDVQTGPEDLDAAINQDETGERVS